MDDNHKVVARIDANSAHSFTFRELAIATRNFRDSHLIGEGGFGKVYKGRLENGQVKLEFICAVMMCSYVFSSFIQC